MRWLLALALVLTAAWRLGGWHIKHTPTADQLFGCDWANTDLASGECK
jgi:hypothetical protein